MDFGNDNDPWECQGDDYCLQREIRLNTPTSLWDELDQSEDDFMFMLEGTTPVKACFDVDSHDSDAGGIDKEPEAYREFSQSKRRRTLQFDTGEQNSSIFTKCKDRENSLLEGDPLHDGLQWDPSFSVGSCTFSNSDVDMSSEGWLSACFNDNGMNMSSDEILGSGFSGSQVDVSGFSNIPPRVETSIVQETPNPPRSRCIFRGKKSLIRTPTKLATSVAYPFALIKPCGVQGDVTLKDINQRIRTPPPQPTTKEDPSQSYPTSAFSGKPVVVKTKIRTEGGKGSITIMRTKG